MSDEILFARTNTTANNYELLNHSFITSCVNVLVSSTHVDTFMRLCGPLARDQITQDTLDGIEVSGVDERVDAVVQVAAGQYCVEAELANREPRTNMHK